MTLFPVKTGLNRKWTKGEIALRPIIYRPCFSLILEEPSEGRSVLCLDDTGEINYHSLQDLVSVEGYRGHIEYMRQDLTGKQYDEAIASLISLSFSPSERWIEVSRKELGSTCPSGEQNAQCD